MTLPEKGIVKDGNKVAQQNIIESRVAAESKENIEELEPELEALLNTIPSQGLLSDEVASRFITFGPNEIAEKKESKLLKFLRYFMGPISFLIELSCVLSIVLGSWVDFGILLGLLILNAFIGYYEESKAENALDALKNNLAMNAMAFRNSKLVEVATRDLVPGDVIILRLGDIIPADCRLLGISSSGAPADNDLQIDQAALTGESLAVNRVKGEFVYSSSIVKQGQMLAVVAKTGSKTFIGRAANLISMTKDVGQFQKIIGKVGNFLIYISVAFVLVILIIRLAFQNFGFLETLREVIVLLIAAIPVGLPTVMSTTMALGAKQLATKKMIVKRLSAVEEFASVTILCSDKTGTLTLNELTLDKPFLNGSYTEEDLLLNAYFASESGAKDAIELAVRNAAEARHPLLKGRQPNDMSIPGYKTLKFVPFNPHSKYTEAKLEDLQSGKVIRCIKGAPHVIIHLCGGHHEAEKAVVNLASRGLRALGVARSDSAEGTDCFELVGLISLLDPPRPDSAQTIVECMKLGVTVKMITGDQTIIGKEVARRLGMNRCILNAESLTEKGISEAQLIRRCEMCDGFGQVIPEHKFRVVELLQRKGYLVGMTGDGVNDAPALKKANVGIAVHGCTEAARSAADLVLLAPGLATIVDGIKCSRAIFQRMRSYAIYRITSTLHFLFFFFLAILIYDFTLPHILILLIAVLNDLATMVIAIDNVLISEKPDKWRIGQLLFMSTVLAFVITAFSFGHFFAAKEAGLDDQQVQTALYLQISSCPHFVIFSTRVGTFLWKSMPGIIFFVAIIGTQIFAMFMSIFGWPAMGAKAIGPYWGVGIMITSFLSMLVIDIIKVYIYRIWSFEFTTKLWPSPKRKRLLKERQESKRSSESARKNWKKVILACRQIQAVERFKKFASEKGLKAGNESVKAPPNLQN